MSARWILRSVRLIPCHPTCAVDADLIPADIEEISQELIEDNIVALSRQMIDKEASVARVLTTRDGRTCAMEIDEEL